MPIFDTSGLRMHATEMSPGTAECLRSLVILERLKGRSNDGTLARLVETRVEQSFNEILFAEVFGYRTLLRHGAGEYHLQPKQYSPITHQYDDFSLGFFGPLSGTRLVTAELKSRGVDLDAPQTDRTNKRSAVEQAHDAVAGEPTVRWVIVSNFDEMRLYRAGRLDAFERVYLTELDSLDDFQRAFALLGAPSLVGHESQLESPLDRLYAGRGIGVLQPKVGYCRLVHEASVLEGKLEELRREPLPMHRLDDAFRDTLAFIDAERQNGLRWWPPRPLAYSARLHDGKLSFLQQASSGDALVETSPVGTMRVCEHIGMPNNNSSILHAEEIAQNMASFVVLAGNVLRRASSSGSIRFRWMLREAGGARLGYPADWASGALTPLEAPGDVEQITHWITIDFSKRAIDKARSDLLSSVRELLFPFERSALGGTVVRLRPDDASFAQLVDATLAFGWPR